MCVCFVPTVQFTWQFACTLWILLFNLPTPLSFDLGRPDLHYYNNGQKSLLATRQPQRSYCIQAPILQFYETPTYALSVRSRTTKFTCFFPQKLENVYCKFAWHSITYCGPCLITVTTPTSQHWVCCTWCLFPACGLSLNFVNDPLVTLQPKHDCIYYYFYLCQMSCFHQCQFVYYLARLHKTC